MIASDMRINDVSDMKFSFPYKMSVCCITGWSKVIDKFLNKWIKLHEAGSREK